MGWHSWGALQDGIRTGLSYRRNSVHWSHPVSKHDVSYVFAGTRKSATNEDLETTKRAGRYCSADPFDYDYLRCRASTLPIDTRERRQSQITDPVHPPRRLRLGGKRRREPRGSNSNERSSIHYLAFNGQREPDQGEPQSLKVSHEMAPLSYRLANELLNHFIRPQQHRGRDRQAERFRGLQIDHQLEIRGLLDRQVGGLGPLEEFPGVPARLP